MRREGQLGTQLQDPQAQRVRGTGAGAGSRHRDGAGGGAGLTIALDHVAAGVADIAKELWTEQGLKQAAGIHAPGPGPGVWPHPAPKGSSCHLPGPPGRPRPPGPEGWSESPPPQETQVEVLPPVRPLRRPGVLRGAVWAVFLGLVGGRGPAAGHPESPGLHMPSHSVPTTGLATGHISQTETLRSQGLPRSRDTQHTGLWHSPHSAPTMGAPRGGGCPIPSPASPP